MKPVEIILSALITIALGLSAFSLKWMFETNAKIEVASHKLDQVLSDTEADLRQDSTLSKHWRLHGWTRSQINQLRVKNQLPIAEWPDLGE